MYCFRIEDSSGIKGKYRVYRSNYQELPNISSDDVDKYIAEEVREAVNGSPSRTALCYSKSLAVCLLKYNKQNLYPDNKLHICKFKRKNCNCVFFRKLKNNDNPDIRRKLKRKKYYIDSNDELYIKCKNIKLCNYILELNNNAELNKYLKNHSPNGKGLKSRASPQKDEEILIMQIDNVVIDRVIEEEKVWIAYLLLGLQLGFGVLSDNEVLFQIKNEIDDLLYSKYERRDTKEIEGIFFLVCYLSKEKNLNFEREAFNRVKSGAKNNEFYAVKLFFDIIELSKKVDSKSGTFKKEYTNFKDCWSDLNDFEIDIKRDCPKDIASIVWRGFVLYLKRRGLI